MFTYGADIGWQKKLEEMGVEWVNEKGEKRDLLEILGSYGINAVRLRVFVNPPASGMWVKSEEDGCMLGYAAKEDVLEEALKAKKAGFRIMIDFHYSDYFADPGCQLMPEQWKNHSMEELLNDVEQHTEEVMKLLVSHGIEPEWVQVGNEINNGMMLPAGEAKGDFKNLTALLNKGYEAVKRISPNSLVVTHLAEGQDPEFAQNYFDHFIKENNGKTDILGLSYYPYWIGSNYTVTIESLKKNLNNLAARYGKDVMVCEIGGNEMDPQDSYNYALEVTKAVKEVPEGRGKGVFWWEPEGNHEFLPDKYPLGATKCIGGKKLQFTKAMEAFS